MRAFLGIDTSNYTTSACVMWDGDFAFVKAPLDVKAGERGIRQSEAVFQHTKNLPSIIESAFEEARAKAHGSLELCAVGVSDKPRRAEGSYMPSFLSGVVSASSVSAAVGCPLYRFSHQEGHIRAAMLGSGMDSGLSHFYSFHLSGGTCELLEVKKDDIGYDAGIVADSADITLGQLIDRTGVMLGLQFPCGAELEALAKMSTEKFRVQINKAKSINLSGFENKTQKMLHDNKSREEIAAYVFSVCTEAVNVLLSFREDKTLPVLFSGGVCSSSILKNSFENSFDAYFAPGMYSADNAIGIAALARDAFLRG